ncbi:type 1 glutamine amidotransferase domain-containing protein [Rhizobium leguminosarum]|uniref:type 1 glutamine amidotransferase domain-containing protein n=1 Tax=Rhizobium leguminosarum TaxID=384 RepID=UPI00143F3B82|nr:type 1 glutamine amidotransferase domain-containing protein [Rhizobium leguminosarum]NKL23897.1 hypothetical protein [Rhizobium leguminosarum bv. viciae]
MKILFVTSSSDTGYWLAELTHPYWHFSERGCEIDFASPAGGKVKYDPMSDPFAENSWEADDLVSKGFLTDKSLVARLFSTIALKDVDPTRYDAIHVVGGGGAAVDLFPNEELGKLLDHFWEQEKVVGTICHGSIALANNPSRVKGRRATGFSRAEDAQVEALYGDNFIPYWPQVEMEKAGILYSASTTVGTQVVIDANLITGQNQKAASEYSIAFIHLLFGNDVVVEV